MIVFLECYTLTEAVRAESRERWGRLGEVVEFSRVATPGVDWVTSDPARDYKGGGAYYALVQVGDVPVGIDRLPREACDVRYVRRIEYHRRDLGIVRRPLVRRFGEELGVAKLVPGKAYCQLGRHVRSRLVEGSGYWRVLDDLERHRAVNLSRLEGLSATQQLTLWEYMLVYAYDTYSGCAEWPALSVRMQGLSLASLGRGIVEFGLGNLAAAKDSLNKYLKSAPLPISADYNYDIYVREYAARSYLWRIAMLEGDLETVERLGRVLLGEVPSVEADTVHRYLLRQWLTHTGITYDGIDAATTPSGVTHYEPYLIYTQPRSGSTLLAQELNSHSEIDCLGELCSGEEPLEYLGQTERQMEYIMRRELDAARLGLETLAAGTGHVRGLKVHGAQLQVFGNQGDLWVKLTGEIKKIVYLHRAPDERRVLSLGLAFENEHFRAHPEFVVYDRLVNLEKYAAIVARQEREDAEYLARAEAVGCVILQVEMGDYLRDREREQRRICEFLGVEYAPMQATTRKQNSWASEELTMPSE